MTFRSFSSLSSKICFFCFGLLFGILVSISFFAFFQRDEELRRERALRVNTEVTLETPQLFTLNSNEEILKTFTPFETHFTTTHVKTTHDDITTQEPTTRDVVTTLDVRTAVLNSTFLSTEAINTTIVSGNTSNEVYLTTKTHIKTTTEERTTRDVTTLNHKTTADVKTTLDDTTTTTSDDTIPVLNTTFLTTESLLNSTLVSGNNSEEVNETRVEEKIRETTRDVRTTPENETFTQNTLLNTTIEVLNSTLVSRNTSEVNETIEEHHVTPFVNKTTLDDTMNATEVLLSQCLSPSFQCFSNQCLSKHEICDGISQCETGEDESHCLADCKDNFRCLETNNTCIPRKHFCDSIADCPLATDEPNNCSAVCLEGEVLCNDKKLCIAGREACDGKSDCFDDSDEKGCVSRDNCLLSRHSFFCSDGLCLPRAFLCDGINDCLNDESDCHETCDGFRCDNLRCISRDKRCDGNDDCEDGSDEIQCISRDKNQTLLVFSRDNWRPICAENITSFDEICRKLGFLSLKELKRIQIFPKNGIFGSFLGKTVEKCKNNESLQIHCFPIICGNNSSDSPPNPILLSDSHGRECPSLPIHPNWLISSASCLKKLNSNEIQIKGKKDFSKLETRFHSRHSTWRNKRFPDFDVSLVFSERELNSSFVCLPQQSVDSRITCFSGEETLEVIERQECNLAFSGRLSSRHLCSSSPNKCLSRGSPLLCLSLESEWYLAGLLSWQFGCEEERARHRTHSLVFSQIFSYKQWIERNIGNSREIIEEILYFFI